MANENPDALDNLFQHNQKAWCLLKFQQAGELINKGYTNDAIELVEKVLVQLEHLKRYPDRRPRSDVIELRYQERHDLEKDFLETSDASLLEFQKDQKPEPQS